MWISQVLDFQKHYLENRNDLNLSGLIVSSQDKVGLDAGTIVGLDELGVKATDNLHDFLNKDIDCIHYTPLASYRMSDDPNIDKNNIDSGSSS